MASPVSDPDSSDDMQNTTEAFFIPWLYQVVRIRDAPVQPGTDNNAKDYMDRMDAQDPMGIGYDIPVHTLIGSQVRSDQTTDVYIVVGVQLDTDDTISNFWIIDGPAIERFNQLPVPDFPALNLSMSDFSRHWFDDYGNERAMETTGYNMETIFAMVRDMDNYEEQGSSRIPTPIRRAPDWR